MQRQDKKTEYTGREERFEHIEVSDILFFKFVSNFYCAMRAFKHKTFYCVYLPE